LFLCFGKHHSLFPPSFCDPRLPLAFFFVAPHVVPAFSKEHLVTWRTVSHSLAAPSSKLPTEIILSPAFFLPTGRLFPPRILLTIFFPSTDSTRGSAWGWFFLTDSFPFSPAQGLYPCFYPCPVMINAKIIPILSLSGLVRSS